MNLDQIFFVFDVESVGLHGEGFAVGWTVVNRMGDELDFGISVCEPLRGMQHEGMEGGFNWVKSNVPAINIISHPALSDMRQEFWGIWSRWKNNGALMAADCAWPVEARFLIDCVELDPASNEWGGPYPLIDIGSVLFAKGIDPLSKFPRLSRETPEHDPLADARQSARLLIETLDKK